MKELVQNLEAAASPISRQLRLALADPEAHKLVNVLATVSIGRRPINMTVTALLNASGLTDKASLFEALGRLEVFGYLRAAIRRDPSDAKQIVGLTITLV